MTPSHAVIPYWTIRWTTALRGTRTTTYHILLPQTWGLEELVHWSLLRSRNRCTRKAASIHHSSDSTNQSCTKKGHFSQNPILPPLLPQSLKFIRQPNSVVTSQDPSKQCNAGNYYDCHQDKGHDNKHCIVLKSFIQKLITDGYLKKFIAHHQWPIT